jgi:EmrB/QacA subfamily drug resistance transporter
MSTDSQARTTGALTERGKQLSLLVLCAAVFLDALDISLIGVTLPSIQADLGLSNGALQWLVSGYTVAYGGFLLLGGRVADLFGRRRTFIAATAVFVVASLAGGLVTTAVLLVASRVVKGIAAAFTAPAAMSLITTTFQEGPERNRALGIFAMTGASGYTFGLVLSGALTELNWRLVFFLPALIALGVLAATRLVRNDGNGLGLGARRLDAAGAVTVTAGLILLVFGLVQAPEWGWGSPGTLGALGAAVLLLVAFLVIESRESDPLVPLGLFRSRTLSAANLTNLVWAGSTIGWQFIASLYLQRLLGYSPLATGLAFIPLGVMILLVARLAAGPLVTRWGVRTVAGVGMLVQAAGVLLFLRIGLEGDYALIMLPALIVHGAGNGLVYPTLNIAGVGGVKDSEQGLASGLITAAYQVGAGIGLAVLTAVLTATTHGSGADDLLQGYRYALLTAGAFSVLGAVIAFVGLRTPRPAEALPAPTTPSSLLAES